MLRIQRSFYQYAGIEVSNFMKSSILVQVKTLVSLNAFIFENSISHETDVSLSTLSTILLLLCSLIKLVIVMHDKIYLFEKFGPPLVP